MQIGAGHNTVLIFNGFTMLNISDKSKRSAAAVWKTSTR